VAILGGLSSLFALLVPVFLSIRDVGGGRGVLAVRERVGHGNPQYSTIFFKIATNMMVQKFCTVEFSTIRHSVPC
jgi:hypothetical protein